MQSWRNRILRFFFTLIISLFSDRVVVDFIFKDFQYKSVNIFIKHLPTSESLRYWSVLCYASSHCLLIGCFLPFCNGCAVVLEKKELIRFSFIPNKCALFNQRELDWAVVRDKGLYWPCSQHYFISFLMMKIVDHLADLSSVPRRYLYLNFLWPTINFLNKSALDGN